MRKLGSHFGYQFTVHGNKQMRNKWFEIDKAGLGKLIERHKKGRLLAELIQNALDEDVSGVEVSITPLPNKPLAEIVVIDDSPEGFRNLADSYTLFAESYKKSDPKKRGRFNFGEKLVLSLCREASLCTTTGTVVFKGNGDRKMRPSARRDRGSEFKAVMRMNRSEVDDSIAFLHTLLIPVSVRVAINGDVVAPRDAIQAFEASLETEVSDDEGVLQSRLRRTTIELFEPKQGEVASLYEMGLPVVETGDKYHVNILQKVPLNLNRDNVRPAYLRRIRTMVFNQMHAQLDSEDTSSAWVQEATSQPDCSNEAISTFLTVKFGENRASYDPSDVEAGKRIQAAGGIVVTGSMLNRDQWRKAKQANAIRPAGVICPSPKPFSDDPNAPTAEPLDPKNWTQGMQSIAKYATFLARELMEVPLRVVFYQIPNRFLACYGDQTLTFNLQYLGHDWFNQGPTEAVDELLIHEFGHQFSGDHLSDDYYEALCRLGARLKRLAIDQPEMFKAVACKTSEAEVSA